MGLRPVVLVHGLMATPAMMSVAKRRLRNHGHDVWLASDLTPLVVGDVRGHARQLSATLTRVRNETGASRVHLVGASQGGLIALWHAFARDWEGIDRVITVGSPLRGSPLATAMRGLAPLLPGLAQIQPGAGFLEALRGIPHDGRVQTIAVRQDRVCPPETATLPGIRCRVVDGAPWWFAHQGMMFQRRVMAAVHEALTEPRC